METNDIEQKQMNADLKRLKETVSDQGNELSRRQDEIMRLNSDMEGQKFGYESRIGTMQEMLSAARAEVDEVRRCVVDGCKDCEEFRSRLLDERKAAKSALKSSEKAAAKGKAEAVAALTEEARELGTLLSNANDLVDALEDRSDVLRKTVGLQSIALDEQCKAVSVLEGLLNDRKE